MTATAATTTPSDLLRVADLNATQLNALLDLADEIANGPTWWTATHDGAAVACLFDKPSPRERSSFETAIHRLGMVPVMLGPDELQPGRGAPLADTARMLSSDAAAIVVSTSAQATLEALAAAASVPVLNAMTDEHHPWQALTDLLTVRRHFGYLEGIRLAYVGGRANVAHSLMEAGALAGMHVTLATPREYGPGHDFTIGALALAAEHGGSIQLGHDPRAAVAGADVVYSDAWVPKAQDAERERWVGDFEGCQIDDALMHLAAPGAVVMHGLPARCGLDRTAAVIGGASSLVCEQAANRVPTAQAMLHGLIGGHHQQREPLR
jgi:ornithine carbamoyltransferase